jgi:hypothetical protein
LNIERYIAVISNLETKHVATDIRNLQDIMQKAEYKVQKYAKEAKVKHSRIL